VSLDDLMARIARLEERQAGLIPSTMTDVENVRVELSRDIANLASGIGTDLREIRAQLTSQGDDIAEIRRLLERRTFRWPWNV